MQGCPKDRLGGHDMNHTLPKRKRIALVAHDNMKKDLLEWAKFNRETLARHALYATGTTGSLVEAELGVEVTKLQSGPLGGDQQIGAMISQGELDLVVFFWDPLEPQPHDPDVKALLRMTVVWNIPVACNRSTADFMIASPLMSGEYRPLVPHFGSYTRRRVDALEEARRPATSPPDAIILEEARQAEAVAPGPPTRSSTETL
jgi:methylglyoxal synthase